MGEIIAIAIIATILGLSTFYIVKAKKRGTKCIGCPNGNSCPHKKDGKCACRDGVDETEC